jgi:tetratricopeptide (TPR) repeat protein
MEVNLGDYAAGRSWAEKALEADRTLGDKWGEAYSLMMIGNAAGDADDLTAAAPALEESVRLFDEIGDEIYASIARSNLSWIVGGLGDTDRERALNERVLADGRASGNERLVAWTLGYFAQYARNEGRPDEAIKLQREGIEIYHRRREPLSLTLELSGLSASLALVGEPVMAARLVGYTNAVFEGLGATRSAWDKDRLDKTMESLNAQLDPAELAAQMSTGRAMTEDQIVDLALGKERPSG